MTGLGLMSWGSGVMRFAAARVKAGECWLCCWGVCRGCAQLREGSDDPPPPAKYRSVRRTGGHDIVRVGGRDTQACQQAQQDDRRRRCATQTGTQMHEINPPSPMPSGIKASCLSALTFFKVDEPSLLWTLIAHKAKASYLPTSPIFTLPPSQQRTHEMQKRDGRP